MQPFLNWVAPIATIVAALMTAANLGSRITGWGFGVFLIGSLLWLWLGIETGETNVIVQNVVLSALNLFGMWRWLGRQARIEDGGLAAQEKSRDAPGETLFPVSLLTHAPVSGPDGTNLGRAVEAMAGCATGRLSYLAVGEGGVAGVGERLRRLDWGDIEVIDDRLHTGHRSLDRLAELEKDNWPAR